MYAGATTRELFASQESGESLTLLKPAPLPSGWAKRVVIPFCVSRPSSAADSTGRCNTLDASRRSVADEATTTDLLHGKPEGADVGALAEGWTLQQIAQLFDRNHSSIQGILAETGGIRPTERSRSRSALTLAEREEISRGVVAGQSMRSIAAQLGRAPSTISREIKRNGGQEGYRASQADQAAWDRGCRPKTCKLAQNRALARLVAGKLRLQWSPEQIAGWLKRTYPDDEPSGVTRDHLSQPVHPGPWRPEEGTGGAFAAHAA